MLQSSGDDMSYLVDQSGTIFVSTPALAKRDGMKPWNGTAEQVAATRGRTTPGRKAPAQPVGHTEPVLNKDPEPELPPEPQPKAVENLRQKLIDAVRTLDPNNPDDYTSRGLPRVGRVSEVMGADVSAAQVMDAVDAIAEQEERDGG